MTTSREQWDAEAESFDAEPDHGLHDPVVRDAWQSLLRSMVPPIPSRIADLGCGTGTLSLLLAEDGHEVDGIDFSPEMIRRATAKAGTFPGTTFAVGDASAPDLAPATYDVVLCRHVLWALPDPAAALTRWVELLAPEGRVVLVEGSWSTGAGLTSEQTVELVEGAGLSATLRPLPDEAYWGGRIDDERYAVLGRRRA
ncbi:class I SAM-dependent methyltransferase [Nocardioides sp.]|uniref:class I SAM-dependent methyltransferase n=1 Tax=Nocardioides sp. TaxID=35761 RepID=UPI00378303B4